ESSQHRCAFGVLFCGEVFFERLPQDQNPQNEQIGVDVGFDDIAMDDGPEQKGAQRGKNDTRNDEFEKQWLIEVAKPDVRKSGNTGGKYLGRVNSRRGQPGGESVTEQHGT